VLQEGWQGAQDAADAGPGSGAAAAEFVLQTLQALTKCGRFSLAVRLLGRADRAAVAQLFERLAPQQEEWAGGSGGGELRQAFLT